MKSWKSQKIPMLFFRILKDGARHCTRYLGLDPPLDLNVHTGTAGTGSDILNTNHMFPNPVSPFTYPDLSTFESFWEELSWLSGNKFARFSAAETLEPAPVNLENVTQKLHSMKTPPGKTQSRRVSQCLVGVLLLFNNKDC